MYMCSPRPQTFPYSRHSSYAELCLLIEAFRPKDIYPCTVDKANWTPSSSMAFLFGHLYPVNQTFRHDQKMLEDYRPRPKNLTMQSSLSSRKDHHKNRHLSEDDRLSLQNGDSSKEARKIGTQIESTSRDNWPRTKVDHYSPSRKRKSSTRQPSFDLHHDDRSRRRLSTANATPAASPRLQLSTVAVDDHFPPASRAPNLYHSELGRLSHGDVGVTRQVHNESSTDTRHSEGMTDDEGDTQAHQSRSALPSSSLTPETRLSLRLEAYHAVLGLDDMLWSDVGLVSTGGHQVKEEEL